MRSRTMLFVLGLIGSIVVSAHVMAQPASTDTRFMSCPTRNGKHIEVTIRPAGSDNAGSFAYSFGVPGQEPELSLSVPISEGTVVPWPGIGRSVWSSVKFPNDGYEYEIWHGFDRNDEDSELEGGVKITKAGDVIAIYQCNGGYIAPLFTLEDAMASAGYCWDFENSRWKQGPCR